METALFSSIMVVLALGGIFVHERRKTAKIKRELEIVMAQNLAQYKTNKERERELSEAMGKLEIFILQTNVGGRILR